MHYILLRNDISNTNQTTDLVVWFHWLVVWFQAWWLWFLGWLQIGDASDWVVSSLNGL
jgi:hypothetical protein